MSAQPKAISGRDDAVLAELTHVELLQRCNRIADERAWNEFVVRYNRFISVGVLRAFTRLGGDSVRRVDVDLVDDLVQDVYVKIFENARTAFGRFRGETEAAVFVYIGKVAISVVASYLRTHRTQRRHSRLVSLDALLDADVASDPLSIARCHAPGPSPERAALNAVLSAEVASMLEQLARGRNAAQYVRITRSYLFGDRTVAEIAAASNGEMCASYVKSTVRRTCDNVRREVARRERRASRAHRHGRPAQAANGTAA